MNLENGGAHEPASAIEAVEVVVVILSWNKSDLVIECIDRVKRLSGAEIRAVVVDNASSDDSVSKIRNAHPDVTLLEEPINRGYAGGVNRGLAEAARCSADFAWLLNDDTAFDDATLGRLLAGAMADRTRGLLTPLLVDQPPAAIVQFRSGVVDWKRASLIHNLPDALQAARIAEGATAIVPGTALLCDLKVYRTIGPFDERYFAYWEDTDYCVRASRAGFGIAVVESSIVAHAAPVIEDRPPHYHYYMVRNEALFWRLHHPTGSGWKRTWLANSLQRLARNRDASRIDNALACVDGIWHVWGRRYGPRSEHAAAPRWLRRLLLGRPWLWYQLVEGDIIAIGRRLAGIRPP